MKLRIVTHDPEVHGPSYADHESHVLAGRKVVSVVSYKSHERIVVLILKNPGRCWTPFHGHDIDVTEVEV